MSELIHEFSTRIADRRGNEYVVAAFGAQRSDGTWTGWLEFSPVNKGGLTLRTGDETSQPNRIALEYWVSGLEPIYLDGALARAQGRLS